jgi:hypothetical protein
VNVTSMTVSPRGRDGILSVRARDKLTDQETRATMKVIGAPEREGEAGPPPNDLLPSPM